MMGLEFSVDKEKIVVSVSVTMSIAHFLQHVTEIYRYAVSQSQQCVNCDDNERIEHDI
jgi:hypothetical protein